MNASLPRIIYKRAFSNLRALARYSGNGKFSLLRICQMCYEVDLLIYPRETKAAQRSLDARSRRAH